MSSKSIIFTMILSLYIVTGYSKQLVYPENYEDYIWTSGDVKNPSTPNTGIPKITLCWLNPAISTISKDDISEIYDLTLPKRWFESGILNSWSDFIMVDFEIKDTYDSKKCDVSLEMTSLKGYKGEDFKDPRGWINGHGVNASEIKFDISAYPTKAELESGTNLQTYPFGNHYQYGYMHWAKWESYTLAERAEILKTRYTRTAMHELGHLLGFYHEKRFDDSGFFSPFDGIDGESIMYQKGVKIVTYPSCGDILASRDLYRYREIKNLKHAHLNGCIGLCEVPNSLKKISVSSNVVDEGITCLNRDFVATQEDLEGLPNFSKDLNTVNVINNEIIYENQVKELEFEADVPIVEGSSCSDFGIKWEGGKNLNHIGGYEDFGELPNKFVIDEEQNKIVPRSTRFEVRASMEKKSLRYRDFKIKSLVIGSDWVDVFGYGYIDDPQGWLGYSHDWGAWEKNVSFDPDGDVFTSNDVEYSIFSGSYDFKENTYMGANSNGETIPFYLGFYLEFVVRDHMYDEEGNEYVYGDPQNFTNYYCSAPHLVLFTKKETKLIPIEPDPNDPGEPHQISLDYLPGHSNFQNLPYAVSGNTIPISWNQSDHISSINIKIRTYNQKDEDIDNYNNLFSISSHENYGAGAHTKLLKIPNNVMLGEKGIGLIKNWIRVEIEAIGNDKELTKLAVYSEPINVTGSNVLIGSEKLQNLENDEIIKLFGYGFSVNLEENYVSFSGLSAEILDVGDYTIQKVDKNGNSFPEEGKYLEVRVPKVSSNGMITVANNYSQSERRLRYTLSPRITGVSDNLLHIGEEVVFYGDGLFSAKTPYAMYKWVGLEQDFFIDINSDNSATTTIPLGARGGVFDFYFLSKKNDPSTKQGSKIISYVFDTQPQVLSYNQNGESIEVEFDVNLPEDDLTMEISGTTYYPTTIEGSKATFNLPSNTSAGLMVFRYPNIKGDGSIEAEIDYLPKPVITHVADYGNYSLIYSEHCPVGDGLFKIAGYNFDTFGENVVKVYKNGSLWETNMNNISSGVVTYDWQKYVSTGPFTGYYSCLDDDLNNSLIEIEMNGVKSDPFRVNLPTIVTNRPSIISGGEFIPIEARRLPMFTEGLSFKIGDYSISTFGYLYPGVKNEDIGYFGFYLPMDIPSGNYKIDIIKQNGIHKSKSIWNWRNTWLQYIKVAPYITDVSQSIIKCNEELVIFGSSFKSATNTLPVVLFGGQAVGKAHYVGDTQLKVMVPLEAQSGNIVVESGGIYSNNYYLSIEPEIFSVTPSFGFHNQDLEVKGQGFGIDPQAVTGFLGEYEMKTEFLTNNLLKTKVPYKAVTDKLFVQKVDDITLLKSNELDFLVLSIVPIIVSPLLLY